MPKSRDTGRSEPPAGKEPPTRSIPDRAEVERAIRSIVDRLKPKPPKPAQEKPAPAKPGKPMPGKPKPGRKLDRMSAGLAPPRRARTGSGNPGIR